MPRLLLLLAMPLVLVACGSGGGERLTKAQYASKADAVCAKYNRQVESLDNPKNLTELAEVADQTIPILERAMGEIRKLRPPESEQETVDQWLGAVDTLQGDLEEIRNKAAVGSRDGVQAVVPQANEHNNRANALATQLGMTVCNRS